MASSGSKAFNLNLVEVIDEAFERAGMSDYTGEDYKSARRSLNLLLTDWINRGINLWTLDLVTITLTSGTNKFTLATDLVDVIDLVRRNSDGVDSVVDRIGLQEYLTQYPDKDSTGKVAKYAVERNAAGGHFIYTWPQTDTASDKLIAWGMSYMDDVSSTGGDQTFDVPKRFVPALCAGLAWHLLLKKKDKGEGDFAMMPILQAQYNDQLTAAQEEDTERSDFFVSPAVGRI